MSEEWYPVNGKPGPEAGFPRRRPWGSRRAGRTVKAKAALKRIELAMKEKAS